MLVISREKDQRIVLRDDIVLTVVSIGPDKVRIGIECPREMPVHRWEIYNAIYGLKDPPTSERSPEEQPFFQAVVETPNDIGMRLIYADWLEDRGDPYGEFIRLQCRLTELSFDDPEYELLRGREYELLDQYETIWRSYYPGLLRGFSFSRGFLEYLEIDARTFLMNVEAIRAATPVCGLRVLRPWNLADHHTALRNLLISPHLASLETLSLDGLQLNDGDLASLIHNPHLTRLRSLNLADNLLSGESARRIAEATNLASLQSLNLLRNPIDADHADLLRARFQERVKV